MGDRFQMLDAMATVIWRAAGGTGRPRADYGPGGAPAKAARDLAGLWESANSTTLNAIQKRVNDELEEAEQLDDRHFGQLLARLSLPRGGTTSWLFGAPMTVLQRFVAPSFSAYLEDDELVWDGEVPTETKNPRRRVSTAKRGPITKGFEVYNLTRDLWEVRTRTRETAEAELAGFKQLVPHERFEIREYDELEHNPAAVVPVPGQAIRSWDHGDGVLVRTCEESNDGELTAYIRLEDGREVSTPLRRTEYDFSPRYRLHRNPPKVPGWQVSRSITNVAQNIEAIGVDGVNMLHSHVGVEVDGVGYGWLIEAHDNGAVMVELLDGSQREFPAAHVWPVSGRYPEHRESGTPVFDVEGFPRTGHRLVKANQSGRFTAKGQELYEYMKKHYEDQRHPRAEHLAARAVYSRAADGVPGLIVRHGKPPGVPNGTRRSASVVTASWGPVHVGDVVEMPADREHGVRGGRATVVALHPGKNWDVTVESRGEEYDLNAGRLLRLIQKA